MATNTKPTPYVAIPTEDWDGLDGNWSTFRISVGNETGQNFRVLVSTRAGAPWVPYYEGCASNNTDCPSSRGVEIFRSQPSRGFQPDQSTTWKELGFWSLDLENNLGFPSEARGLYGFDTLRLGFGSNTDAVVVNKTQVVTFTEPAYWMGMLGMGNVNTSLKDSDPPTKNFIQTLNDTGRIPSLSYGYTAGAHHRYKKVPGSLVIGGYDQSRFKPEAGYDFHFAQDPDRFLYVGVQSILTNFSFADLGPKDINEKHFSVIDSSVSHLWLPEKACNNFEAALGLTYDGDSNYYFINDTTHKRLLDKNPTLSFRLGNGVDVSDSESVQIDLPYAAFDLSIRYPAYGNHTGDERRYFPIRRGQNESQYTIGRVLLQEAYLTVNYEQKNFSLAQASFFDPMPDTDIRPIHSASWVDSTPSSSLSGGAKAGIAIGVIAGVLLLFSAVYLYWWRPRKQKRKTHNKRPSVVSQAPTYQSSAEPPPHYFREGKEPYDPWAAAEHQRQQNTGHEQQYSVSEMPAGADNQARRPELDGVNVGGSSYELPAPVKEREDDVVVYEMGVSHETASSNADQDTTEVESRQVERRGSEQRRTSEPSRQSQVETTSV